MGNDAKLNRELWDRACAGDPEARALVFDELLPQLHRIASRRVHRADAVEDILQQATVRALRGMHRLRAKTAAGFLAWFARIVDGELRRHLASRVSPHHATEAVCSRTDEAPLDEPEVPWLASDSGLAALQPARRLALLLRDGFELPWATIGFALGRSTGAARVLHHRSVRDLQESIGRADDQAVRPSLLA